MNQAGEKYHPYNQLCNDMLRSQMSRTWIMSLFKALMTGGLIVVSLLALQFSPAQAGDQKVVIPALILPDVQDGLYYQQEELTASVDKRIRLHFVDRSAASGYSESSGLVSEDASAEPVTNPPFRP